MRDSILQSIKKLLGIDGGYSEFDTDIVIHINTVLANLVQMGVGPAEGFTITGETEKWEDFLGDTKLLEQVKTYVYLKVRLVFDPPANASLLDAFNKTASELEWRMYVQKGGY